MIPPHLSSKAFIFAAGRGERLRPLTDDRPKPMVDVAGRPIIDYILEMLAREGISSAVANTHYRHQILEDHLTRQTILPVETIHEPVLLETGGGLKNALPRLNPEPLIAVGGDMILTGNPIARMIEAWKPGAMDVLLLLHPRDKMTITKGSGDYDITPDGRPALSPDKTGPYFWTSARIVDPAALTAEGETIFSFLKTMKRAEATGRLGFALHDGDCFHITTPQDWREVNAHFLPPAPLTAGFEAGPKVA